ncbi:hypothetical protein D9619_000331 [Psilocybe cf. subviscida]|uniref:HMG box domain-containing protein n=1 Tax=Psilocybe cf. subviscida TaxID=2480587 RepID=A0A8H5BHS9_9AGAR|nr:hypothetical protein D9619_000331 [Psilocybe cf. subviscida]
MSSPPQLYTMPPLSPTFCPPALTYAYPSPHIISPNASWPTSSSVSGGAAKIPRPPNAFMLFRGHFLKTRQIPLDEECRQQTISCVVGECWNMLPADEKAVWRRRAEEAKCAHMARYPGYKFSPSPCGTKASKKAKQSKPRDEAAVREKKERTRKLREEFTSFKGEAVPSQRKTKELARSVRGAERATHSRKAHASTSTSASYPAASADLTNTPSSPSAATATSALFAPLPRLTLHGAFVPSSTRLTPAPSAGPQIMHIIQSPPLTPFHPNDRHPQLQLPEITLHDPSTAQWGFHQECEFRMGEISPSQGDVYPPMGASAYFEPKGPGMHVPVPVSEVDLDHARSRSHSLDVGIGNMNVNVSTNNYLDLHVDYPTFSVADGIDSFTGNYRDAPETPSSPAHIIQLYFYKPVGNSPKCEIYSDREFPKGLGELPNGPF